MKTRLAFTALLLYSAIAGAQEKTDVLKLSDLSLDQLLNVKVVTATGYLQKTDEAPSTIQVITARQIADRGYEQLEDALRDVNGIDLIHINGYAPTLIYFRGLYGAENLRALLMIDGIPETNIIGSNDMAGPAYSLHNADRIEIIWGPVSALYGANAFGGVINIITKKGADIQGITVEKGVGTFNTSVEKFMLGARRSKFDVSLSGSLFSTDGPVFANRDPMYHASYVDNAYTLNGQVTYAGNVSKITAGFRTARTPMGWGAYANSPSAYLKIPPQGNGNNGLIGILTRDIRDEDSGLEDSYKRATFIQGDFSPGEKFKAFGRIVYRETGTGEDSYAYVAVNANRLIRTLVATYSNRISGEFSANYSPAVNHRISFGVDMYQDNVERGARRTTIDLTTVYLVDGHDTVTNLRSTYLPRLYDIRNNIGSYFQYILNTHLLGKTDFTFGARWDHNTYFGNAASPRVAIVNQPSERLTFKFQFGTAFRAPTNVEIYQTPGGDFQLNKEKIKTYELNALYSFSNNVHLQVNGFHNRLTDGIVIANLSGTTINKNPGIFDISGLETAVDIGFSTVFSGYLNFMYQDARGKNIISGVSGRIPGVAPLKANAGFTVHADSLFSLSLGENYVGKRGTPRTDPYGPVAGYFLTNIALNTRKLFNEHVTASLSVHNVFNTSWLDPGFRTADGLLYSTVLEQPGRTALLKVGINF